MYLVTTTIIIIIILFSQESTKYNKKAELSQFRKDGRAKPRGD